MSRFENLPDGNGDCFRSAANEVIYGGHQDGRVCHGVVTGQGHIKGVRFAHAWVEVDYGDEAMVIDRSNGRAITMPRDLYYAIGEIDSTAVERYEKAEVLRHIQDTHQWGPWS